MQGFVRKRLLPVLLLAEGITESLPPVQHSLSVVENPALWGPASDGAEELVGSEVIEAGAKGDGKLGSLVAVSSGEKTARSRTWCTSR